MGGQLVGTFPSLRIAIKHPMLGHSPFRGLSIPFLTRISWCKAGQGHLPSPSLPLASVMLRPAAPSLCPGLGLSLGRAAEERPCPSCVGRMRGRGSLNPRASSPPTHTESLVNKSTAVSWERAHGYGVTPRPLCVLRKSLSTKHLPQTGLAFSQILQAKRPLQILADHNSPYRQSF